MPCQMNFRDRALRAEKLAECIFTTLTQPLEPAILIFNICSSGAGLRELKKDLLLRTNRGLLGESG
jgi:hypothetical protein